MAHTTTRISPNDISAAVLRWMEGKPLTDAEALIVVYATMLNRADLLDRIVSSYEESAT